MTKISKEDRIVLIVFAICVLIPPVAIIAIHFYELDPLTWLKIDWGRTALGYICLTLATLTCLFNFYVSIYVPWEYERKHGSMEDFAHMSGLPILGSIFVLGAGVLLPSSIFMGIFLLFLYVFDGNGLPYLLFCIVRDGL